MTKKTKNVCQNCNHFDNSKHKKDDRTNTAGICTKWCEIVFQSDTCKSYIDEPMTKEIFVFKPLEFQYDLFK